MKVRDFFINYLEQLLLNYSSKLVDTFDAVSNFSHTLGTALLLSLFDHSFIHIYDPSKMYS